MRILFIRVNIKDRTCAVDVSVYAEDRHRFGGKPGEKLLKLTLHHVISIIADGIARLLIFHVYSTLSPPPTFIKRKILA